MQKSNIILSLLPLIVLISLIAICVSIFGDGASSGPIQISLLSAAFLCAGISIWKYKVKWDKLEKGVVRHLSTTAPALVILMLIGALSGTWMLSGVVPAMIYYGLKLIHPSIFLVATCLLCSVVSVVSGSSWTTVATIGVAMLGIGKILGFDAGWIAGAIISGAYFGDKISPLSDTTNLASSVAGVDLFTHIRYMMTTTTPTYAVTLIIFTIAGFWHSPASAVDVSQYTDSIKETFNLSMWVFLVPIITGVLIAKKVPAIITLFVSALLGGIFAIIFQPDICMQIVNAADANVAAFFTAVMQSLYGSVQIVTGNATLDGLTATRGMTGMIPTVWLIICTMTFGGMMEASGMLHSITNAIISRVKGTFGLVASTTGTCLFMNVATSDQYMAILLSGNMFSDAYKERGYKPEVLSRTLEDSATVTSVLVPWNTCGVTQAAVLHISTFTYIPYCFFNIISPLMTLLFAALNYKIRRLGKKQDK